MYPIRLNAVRNYSVNIPSLNLGINDTIPLFYCIPRDLNEGHYVRTRKIGLPRTWGGSYLRRTAWPSIGKMSDFTRDPVTH
ncbi:hypothetical protein AFLA_013495 [Aspergillus flavus NRRL3357]|nr:hypothetical protein AFLA_013495 [Aspergillus flavus NRRL3357]